MSHSTALVNELHVAKRLILKHFGLGIGSLMHIAGLRDKLPPASVKARFDEWLDRYTSLPTIRNSAVHGS